MTTFDAVKLGSLPAACMLLFTLLGLGKDVPPTIAGAMQHFAAGVLLCTVGTELLPEMVGAEGLEQNVAVGVGFFLGVALLILLGVLIPEHEDDNEEDINKKYSGDDNHEDEKENPRSFRANRQSLISAASHCKEFCNSPTRSGVTARTVVAKEESPLLPSTQGNGAKAFPLALVLAIAIDSALDGLLIGIACAAGPSAGPMMSASLSVEMSFLGLTLATALHGHPATKSIPASILGPLILVLGAAMGGFLATSLSENPVLFAGLLSFGTSALLFMVAEELLLEAHEDGCEHVWWVDLQLYIGFYASVMLGKFMPEI